MDVTPGGPSLGSHNLFLRQVSHVAIRQTLECVPGLDSGPGHRGRHKTQSIVLREKKANRVRTDRVGQGALLPLQNYDVALTLGWTGGDGHPKEGRQGAPWLHTPTSSRVLTPADPRAPAGLTAGAAEQAAEQCRTPRGEFPSGTQDGLQRAGQGSWGDTQPLVPPCTPGRRTASGANQRGGPGAPGRARGGGRAGRGRGVLTGLLGPSAAHRGERRERAEGRVPSSTQVGGGGPQTARTTPVVGDAQGTGDGKDPNSVLSVRVTACHSTTVAPRPAATLPMDAPC